MPVVEVVVAVDDAELAADALWQAHPSAVEESLLSDGRVRLRADVTDLALVDTRWRAVEVADPPDDPLDAWRAFAQPVRVGSVVLHPAWLPPDRRRPGDLVVPLDPGRTFGSGSHPSTRLAVAALQVHLRRGDRVLDVGTGSGVLAVVAALLGAAEVLGTDLDPGVLEIVPRNAAANGVADRVRVTTEPLESVAGPFDLVVANIGLGTLESLAPTVVGLLAADARVVLAGVLDHQAAQALAAYSPCAEIERGHLDGWAAPVLRR